MRPIKLIRPIRPLRCAIALAALTLLWVPSGAAAAATECPAANPYPGDDAGAVATANWMARGAGAAGLPGELPVMAALVESGLRNLPDGGSGYAGFFQMSARYFDRGAYAGFASRPELQLRWFTDTAVAVRERRLADGRPDPLLDDRSWGEWIADVERPAARYRDRYQLRLADARALIEGGCETAPPADDGISLWGGTEQPLRRRVRVAVVCADTCQTSANGMLRLPERGERFALTPASGAAAAGEKLRLALKLPRAATRAARKALRRGERVRARIDVSAVASDGVESSGRRVVRLG